jgi:hypothetical protein
MSASHDPREPTSLYQSLATAAPLGTDGGGTMITATKETIDNDTEDTSDDILEL